MDPQLALLVRCEVFPPQVVDIREGQSRQRAEAEDIPDAVQPLVGIGRVAYPAALLFAIILSAFIASKTTLIS